MSLEAWLTKDEFKADELRVFDRFVPYFIFTFTETVKRKDGKGMKLIKINLLHYFTTMISYLDAPRILICLFQNKITEQKLKKMQEGLLTSLLILN